jgi:aryl-alcohol dehydrogenase-like predicted oxidoreductase
VDTRRLGRTSLRVTPIGYGAFKIGRNEGIKYAAGYELPTDTETECLLRAVLDLGIRYVDTAPAYGLSEERVGRALAGQDCVVSTKVGEEFRDGKSVHDFSAKAIRASVDRSRRRLWRDVLDLVFLHAPAQDLNVLRETEGVETLLDLRARGLVRAVGLSAKTVAAAQQSLSWADALMVEYHLRDRSHEAVMSAAAAAGVGVIVKKGLASGYLPADESVRFVLNNPSVTALLVSSLSLDHLRENVAAAVDVLCNARRASTQVQPPQTLPDGAQSPGTQ